MSTVLIGIAGEARSGKNTAASFVREFCEARGLSFRERGFADAVKWSAARCFFPAITEEAAIEWANEIKFDHEICTWKDEWASPDVMITGRQFLQHYGTEAHRDIFGKDFWVDHLLPWKKPGGSYNSYMWKKSWGEPDVAVVTDVRFQNEAERIKNLGGHLWRIERRAPGDRPFPLSSHSSESGVAEIHADMVVENFSSLSSLNASMTVLMQDFFPHEEYPPHDD